jgi:putative methyltransferase (TIGR04325 family)
MATVAGGFRRLASTTRHVPVLRGALAEAYRRYFNGARGSQVRLFRGVYPSFEAASRSIPAGRPLGYDDPISATRMLSEWLDVHPADYPILFWLAKLLPESNAVFDWGGSVGLKYFAFRRYLDYAPSLDWLVSEVPAVVELGRKIAREEGAAGLRFTSDFTGMANADILLAGGVMHFVEEPFFGLRTQLQLPRHLLINKAPVYQMPSAVTLHNIGTSFCPYHLFNRSEFVTEIEKLGYRLVDEWRLPGVACQIPFHPEHSIGAYTGFYFTRSE